MRYERAKKLVFALVGGLMVALLAFQLFLRGHRSVQHVPRASAASPLSQGSSEAKSATPTEGQAALSMQLPAALLTSIADELPGYSLPDASTGDHPFRYLCETREASPIMGI